MKMKYNLLILLGLILLVSSKKTKFTTEIKITSNEDDEEPQKQKLIEKNNTSSEDEESDKEKNNESDKEKEKEKEEEFKTNEQEYESWLIKQFTDFETNIINLINERNIYYKDIIKIREKGKIELQRLNKDIKNLENHNQTLNDNEEIKYFKNTKEYTTPELMDDVLKYITELAELLGFDTNDESFKDKSPTNWAGVSINTGASISVGGAIGLNKTLIKDDMKSIPVMKAKL